MGLLGCPTSFQCLMETVLRNISNDLVYIDDVLLHTATHEEHLKVLEKVLERLHQNHLQVNLDKCVFGNKEVSYLGFMLTPDGIKPGRNKLQAIRDAQPPTNIKMVRSFVRLCNFFRTHIKDFAIIAAPLFRVTRKDSGYKSGPLPPDALHAFNNNSLLTLSWLFPALTDNMPLAHKNTKLCSSTTGLNLASQQFTFLQIKIYNKRHFHSQYFQHHLLHNQLKSRYLHNRCYFRINRVRLFNRIKINHL